MDTIAESVIRNAALPDIRYLSFWKRRKCGTNRAILSVNAVRRSDASQRTASVTYVKTVNQRIDGALNTILRVSSALVIALAV